jgi:hypothetical protein
MLRAVCMHVCRLRTVLRLSCTRFELFEFIRKLLLIGVLTAVAPSSEAYLNVAHAVSFFSLIVFANCRPFVEPRLDRCDGG